MTHFRITAVSDTVCPWCYIGRRQLLLAQQLWQQQHPGSSDTFSVTYAPFQLNPHWPRGPASSTDKAAFYRDMFGPDRAPLMHERARAAGDRVGIAFKFGGRTGNSRDSHRLVRLAHRYGDGAELRAVDGLFAAYFEQERDITDYEVLRAVATGAGIPDADFQKAIVDSDEGGREVDEAAARARAGGVAGVPDYTIQDRFHLGGARDPSDFVRVFEKVKELEKASEGMR